MGNKGTKEESSSTANNSDENLRDVEFISVPDKQDKQGKELPTEKKGEETKGQEMSPAIAMCFYAGKGDIEAMKKIYTEHPKSVLEGDYPKEEKEEEKDKKKKTKEDDAEKALCAISGDFPLHRAAAEGQMAALELLLNWEADLESKNRIGSTPLHRAASHGQVETVKKLLENGSNVDAINKIGSSPLHCAAFSGFVEVAKLICARGGFKHIRRPNLAGMTPLDYAKNCKPMWEFFLTYDHKGSSRSVDPDSKQRGDKSVTLHNVTGRGSFHKKHLSVEGDRGSFHKKTVTIQDDPQRKSSDDSQPITLHIRSP